LGCSDNPNDWRRASAIFKSSRRLALPIEYVDFARKVAAGLRGINPKLEEQFDEAARAAERSFKPAI
jgi:hypothetical protein